MKKLLMNLWGYSVPILFLIFGALTIIAGTSNKIGYDRRTYITVLGVTLIFLSFRLMDSVERIKRKKIIDKKRKGRENKNGTTISTDHMG